MDATTYDPIGTEPRSAALDSALAELSDGWAEGRNPLAEVFARDVAEEGRSALLELVYHEFCLAEDAGLAPNPTAYLARFPDLSEDLIRLFGLHNALDDSVLRSWSTPAGPPPLPEAGDEIGPYRLLRELGRGGLARVFLAEQSDLGDRLVVLKVSARPSPEGLLQARAGHPHIVAVLREAKTGDGGLHLLAMPFLGGATLAAVLAREAADRRRFTRRTGRTFLAALDRASAPEFLPAEVARSAVRDLLASLTRAEAAAWIVARLAEALDHAQRLGVTHGDLKPANLLVAADARPMLFDFNLAADASSGLAALSAPTGGTLAYMAPERLRALAEPKSAPIPKVADLHRADIYAIGLVLREILTGRPPVFPGASPSLVREAAAAMAEARERAGALAWSAVRGVPIGLRPVLARCLAPDPADRYASAGELTEDLDLWRKGRSPTYADSGAGDPSRLWRLVARHRAASAVAATALILATVVGGLAWSSASNRMRGQAEAKLASLWDSGDPAIFRGRRFGAWRLDDDATAESARRNLDRYDVLGPDDWRDRDDVRALGATDRDDLEMWLAEQAWRLASAWSKRPAAPEEWRRALALLERSPEWAALGAYTDLRATIRARLGLPAPGVSATKPPAWLDAYTSALEAEATDPRSAATLYARVLAEHPGTLWPRYRAAGMASRLGDHRAAADGLARCLKRRPNSPAILTQRAGCLNDSGKPREAMALCDRVLALDPDYRDAYIVRSLARLALGQVVEAQADVDRFVALSRSRPAEAAGADMTFEGKRVRPGHPARTSGPTSNAAEAQALVAVEHERAGRAIEAIAAYEKAIEYDPDDLGSRARRAHLLRRARRNEGIYEMAALIEEPRFEELVRQEEEMLRLYHFVVEYRLRNGAVDEARAVAERALKLALTMRPEGATESPMVAESRYALARALAPLAVSDPTAARRAAELLKQAGRVDRRFLEEKFPRDSLFDAARGPIAEALR